MSGRIETEAAIMTPDQYEKIREEFEKVKYFFKKYVFSGDYEVDWDICFLVFGCPTSLSIGAIYEYAKIYNIPGWDSIDIGYLRELQEENDYEPITCDSYEDEFYDLFDESILFNALEEAVKRDDVRIFIDFFVNITPEWKLDELEDIVSLSENENEASLLISETSCIEVKAKKKK